jgi:putative hemolysin
VARWSAVAGLGLAALLLAGCAASSSPTGPAATAPARLANPASQNCVAKGGALSIEKNGSGGEYGLCRFADNRQCEEWAMFRGECPVGGLRVTGYVTPAARYCAVAGGQYAVTGASNTSDEQGMCAFPSGKRCDARAYYDGACSKD